MVKGKTITGEHMKNMMMKLFAVVLMTLAVPALAAEEVSGGVPYTRIVAHADGESSFEDGLLPFSMMQLPAGEKAGLHMMQTGGEATYMMFPPGVFEEFHVTPNAQMLIVVQGEVEVGVSSGEIKRFGPGDVVMMEDNTGKGHTTRVVGEIPHIALMIRHATD